MVNRSGDNGTNGKRWGAARSLKYVAGLILAVAAAVVLVFIDPAEDGYTTILAAVFLGLMSGMLFDVPGATKLFDRLLEMIPGRRS